MARTNRLSIVDKLLIAAIELERKGKNPFSAEDLVVNAWKNFPDAFGLAGYIDEEGYRIYPDSNRVFAEIMGSKPIRKNGYLRKVGTKMYQLTEAGQSKAKQLSESYGDGGNDVADVGKTGLSRDMVLQIKRLFSSKAVEKYLGQRIEEITFYDACSFWGITPRSKSIDLVGKISNFKNVVEIALKDAKGKKVSFEHGGRSYSPKELKLLLKVHDFLMNNFKEQVEVIRKRRDERV